MDDLLTTRQVQDTLKVDRITIYRMLQDGRIKGVKVGQQWRFARQEIERILSGEPADEALAQPSDSIFPTHCVQTIQDLFSDVSQASALVIAAEGEPVTQTSHPCAFCQLIQSSPSGREACRASWREFARNGRNGSSYFTCHAGLQYVSAPIYDKDRKDQQVGAFLAGQFYWQPPDAREETERVRRLATMYNLPQETLRQEAAAIPTVPAEQHSRLEGWPFAAARAVQSILHERLCFVERLQKIATLTQLS
jgi:excisionase family DNA binding protein